MLCWSIKLHALVDKWNDQVLHCYLSEKEYLKLGSSHHLTSNTYFFALLKKKKTKMSPVEYKAGYFSDSLNWFNTAA